MVDQAVLEEDLCLEQGCELLAIRELDAKPTVERLGSGDPPRRSKVDQDGTSTIERDPCSRPSPGEEALLYYRLVPWLKRDGAKTFANAA